jgi:copper(I)-binding protein
MRKIAIIGLLLALSLSAGCSSKELSVENIWSRPANQGGVGAVYFVIDNPTSQPDALFGASSDIAESVEMHMSMMQEDSTMSMAHQDAVPIPANSTVEFEPGGLHIMLVNLSRDLNSGDQFKITLNFQNAGDMILDAEVMEP